MQFYSAEKIRSTEKIRNRAFHIGIINSIIIYVIYLFAVMKMYLITMTMMKNCQFMNGLASSKSKRLYSPEQLLKILLNSNLQSSNVLCGKVPTSVSSNVVFVVDVNKLDDPNDLLCDDTGVWRNNGVDSVHYLVSLSNGQASTLEKSFSSDEAAYTLKRVYRVHGTNPGLKKLTVYIYGM